jgi:ATP sulfurylase
MALGEVAKEIMWIRMILKELNIAIVTPSIIYVDNQPAIRISENDSDHDRTKHIDVRHYFIRDLIKEGAVKPVWISTHDQLADILTKPLSSQPFIKLRNILMKCTHNENDVASL